MHIKNIRKTINKQLKSKHPHWKSMTRKDKNQLAREVVDEVVKNYDYSQSLDLPVEALAGIDNQTPSGGIRSLSEMAEFIDNFHSDNLFGFDKKRKPYPEIIDPELKFIDELFDDQVINTLLAPDSHSAPHRDIHPYRLFRMELLKILKYPEISYRKFCTDEYFGPVLPEFQKGRSNMRF